MLIELGIPRERILCVKTGDVVNVPLTPTTLGVVTACSMPHNPALYQKINHDIRVSAGYGCWRQRFLCSRYD
jgi:hypothetical protein